jgi:hypothetical protein
MDFLVLCLLCVVQVAASSTGRYLVQRRVLPVLCVSNCMRAGNLNSETV